MANAGGVSSIALLLYLPPYQETPERDWRTSEQQPTAFAGGGKEEGASNDPVLWKFLEDPREDSKQESITLPLSHKGKKDFMKTAEGRGGGHV